MKHYHKFDFASFSVAAMILSGVVAATIMFTNNAALSAEDLPTAKANFAKADADADGNLEFDEFKGLINANADSGFRQAAKIRRFGAYDRAFAAVDRNGDGQVTWSEFAAAQGR